MIIWLYPLFKKISYEAQKRDHPAKPDPGLLASAYIASWIASFPLAWLLPYGALLIVSLAVVSVFVLATIPVQQAANAVKVTGSPSRNSPTLGEIFFLLVGGAMLVINISTAIKMPGITPMEDVRMRMQSMKEYLRLSVDYAVCTENLKTRLSLLDRRDQEAVDSYNTAHEACEAIKVRMDELAKKLETGSRAY